MNLKSYTANPHSNLAEGNTLPGSAVAQKVNLQKFQAIFLKLLIWLFGILMLLLPIIINATEYSNWINTNGTIVTEGVIMRVDSEDPSVTISKVEIFDASTKVVLNQDFNCTRSYYGINISSLASGFYDVEVTTCDDKSFSGIITTK